MLTLILVMGCIRTPPLTTNSLRTTTTQERILCNELLPVFIEDLPGQALVASTSSHVLLYSAETTMPPTTGTLLLTECIEPTDRMRFIAADVASLACTAWTPEVGLLLRHLGGWAGEGDAVMEAWLLVPNGNSSTGDRTLRVHTLRYSYQSDTNGNWNLINKEDVSEGRRLTIACPTGNSK